MNNKRRRRYTIDGNNGGLPKIKGEFVAMQKGLLVGNGFSSQLIEEYKNSNLHDELLRGCPNECDLLYEFWSGFQSERDFQGQDTCALISKIESFGVDDAKNVFDDYFHMYGLKADLREGKPLSVESYLKIAKLYKLLVNKAIIDEEEITRVANETLYNNGCYGLDDTKLSDDEKRRLRFYLREYSVIFTTNYDLILDDAIEPNIPSVYHLHGGFNIRRNQQEITGERLKAQDACLVWGVYGIEKEAKATAEKKYNSGLEYNKGYFYNKRNILKPYYDLLEQLEIDELHVIGFSGENDQHINKRIQNNPFISRIIYYRDPKQCETSEYISKIEKLFTPKIVTLVSWDRFWGQIYDNN